MKYLRQNHLVTELFFACLVSANWHKAIVAFINFTWVSVICSIIFAFLYSFNAEANRA